MDDHQRSLRRAAAEAFMESLEQLAVSLKQEEGQSDDSHEPLPDPINLIVPKEPIDLQAFEEAAADIEQFIQTSQSEEKAECRTMNDER